LRNARIDEQTMVARWAKTLQRGNNELLIAIDWTEWSRGLRLLVAAVVVERRAIPVCVRGFAQRIWRRSQNTRENDFLRLLSAALKQAKIGATILCDRGFRRVSWLKLIDTHGLRFVVRLMDDVHVEINGQKRPLSSVSLDPGKVLDLGSVALRIDGKFSFRVIGYRAKGAKQIWWLATNRKDDPAIVLSLYDRRMTVEEQFRDLKGKRFGVKLSWTQFRDPVQLARFMMLLAMALLIWLIEGRAAVARRPDLRMTSKSKGHRQSLITIGLRLGVSIPLTHGRLRFWLPPPQLREILGSSLGGK
jgi:hypothetical protein